MTHKREGMCIGGPWAGSFRSAMSGRIEFQIRQDPPEAQMYKLGAYVHHTFAVGEKTVQFWAMEFVPLVEVFEELMEGYWRYQDASR